METLKTKCIKLFTEIKKLHPNDDFSRYEKWGKLTEIFSANIDDTISLLKQANEEEILWASSVFEDVAFMVKSDDYIHCLEGLVQKFPTLDLEHIVEISKSYHNT